ncbi:hypothetical protein [Asticcacaulis excentricus]|uniref:hypothetical protein n=1 Tax=Asticcacaulis excentricus TaxID=78587 RepID=UPI00143BEA6B|nr:hypothetical protein [Asticcacaulis excentricus]
MRQTGFAWDGASGLLRFSAIVDTKHHYFSAEGHPSAQAAIEAAAKVAEPPFGEGR